MSWFVEGWRWYLDSWKNYSNFKGRSRRKAYWYFNLFHYGIMIHSFVLALFVLKSIPLLILVGIYICASIVPVIAVTVRRLQDTDHDWAWLYVPFPFRLDVLTEDSQPKDNKYGPDPKKDERFNVYDSDLFQQAK